MHRQRCYRAQEAVTGLGEAVHYRDVDACGIGYFVQRELSVSGGSDACRCDGLQYVDARGCCDGGEVFNDAFQVFDCAAFELPVRVHAALQPKQGLHLRDDAQVVIGGDLQYLHARGVGADVDDCDSLRCNSPFKAEICAVGGCRDRPVGRLTSQLECLCHRNRFYPLCVKLVALFSDSVHLI